MIKPLVPIKQVKDNQTCKKKTTTKTQDGLCQRFAIVIEYCQLPCGRPGDAGNPMCIRTCSCPKNYMLTKEKTCKQMSAEIRDKINNNADRAWEAHSSALTLSRRDEGKGNLRLHLYSNPYLSLLFVKRTCSSLENTFNFLLFSI